MYPKLSSLVKIDQLPEQLSFITDNINTIFDNLYFRNLQVSVSPVGASL